MGLCFLFYWMKNFKPTFWFTSTNEEKTQIVMSKLMICVSPIWSYTWHQAGECTVTDCCECRADLYVLVSLQSGVTWWQLRWRKYEKTDRWCAVFKLRLLGSGYAHSVFFSTFSNGMKIMIRPLKMLEPQGRRSLCGQGEKSPLGASTVVG